MASVKGRIKWYDPRKGYGFMTTDDGRDVFIHHSGVESGRTYLGFHPGDKVTCELEETEKGFRAQHVNMEPKAEKK